ncbi:MAG: 1-acyl-sn-glycerol-3-phosphate acyltransferase [Comamonadaceae bacterium]|nr:1-acyl-sn-glycerol-3-phosphate acyltransferase [Comamonadaceae bacterium]
MPAFNAYIYFRIGYWIGKTLSQLAVPRAHRLHRRRRAERDPRERDGGVRDEPPQQHGLHHRVATWRPSARRCRYAVGEWARVWGLQQLIRAMGAYFVRRNSKDELYRRVLERYIAMATEAGVTQAVYPEGGLTRDGALREPRFGVLDYMLRGFHTAGRARPGVRAARPELRPRARGPHAVARAATRRRAQPGRCARRAQHAAASSASSSGCCCAAAGTGFGYACVNFGTPVSVRAWCAARGIDFEQLAKRERGRPRWPRSAAT